MPLEASFAFNLSLFYTKVNKTSFTLNKEILFIMKMYAYKANTACGSYMTIKLHKSTKNVKLNSTYIHIMI